jgi:hypothetical protein
MKVTLMVSLIKTFILGLSLKIFSIKDFNKYLSKTAQKKLPKYM